MSGETGLAEGWPSPPDFEPGPLCAMRPDHRAPDEALPGVDLAIWWLMARSLREEVIGAAGSSDPPWYILLDLYRAQAVGSKVQITSLSPMIGVPHSTAGRWARQLIDKGLIIRVEDPGDRRRSYVELSPYALGLMRHYFQLLSTRRGPLPVVPVQRNGTC